MERPSLRAAVLPPPLQHAHRAHRIRSTGPRRRGHDAPVQPSAPADPLAGLQRSDAEHRLPDGVLERKTRCSGLANSARDPRYPHKHE